MKSKKITLNIFLIQLILLICLILEVSLKKIGCQIKSGILYSVNISKYFIFKYIMFFSFMKILKFLILTTIYQNLITKILCTTIFIEDTSEYKKNMNNCNILRKIFEEENGVILENAILYKLSNVIDDLPDLEYKNILDLLSNSNYNVELLNHEIYNLLKELIFKTIVNEELYDNFKIFNIKEEYIKIFDKNIIGFLSTKNFTNNELYHSYCKIRNSKYNKQDDIKFETFNFVNVLTAFIVKISDLFGLVKKRDFSFLESITSCVSQCVNQRNNKKIYTKLINEFNVENKGTLLELEEKIQKFFNEKYLEKKIKSSEYRSIEDYSKNLNILILCIRQNGLNYILSYLNFLFYNNIKYRKFFNFICFELKKISNKSLLIQNEENFKIISWKLYLITYFDLSNLKVLENYGIKTKTNSESSLKENLEIENVDHIKGKHFTSNRLNDIEKIFKMKKALLKTIFNYFETLQTSYKNELKQIFISNDYFEIEDFHINTKIEKFENLKQYENSDGKKVKSTTLFFVYQIAKNLNLSNHLDVKINLLCDLNLDSAITSKIKEDLRIIIKNNIYIKEKKIFVKRNLKLICRTISIKQILDKNFFFIHDPIEEQIEREKNSIFQSNIDGTKEKIFFRKIKATIDFFYKKNLDIKKIQNTSNTNFNDWIKDYEFFEAKEPINDISKEQKSTKKIEYRKSIASDCKNSREKFLNSSNVVELDLPNKEYQKIFFSSQINDMNYKKVEENKITVIEKSRKKKKIKTRSSLPGNFFKNDQDVMKSIKINHKDKKESKLETSTQEDDDKNKTKIKIKGKKYKKKHLINTTSMKKQNYNAIIAGRKFLEYVKISKEHLNHENKQNYVATQRKIDKSITIKKKEKERRGIEGFFVYDIVNGENKNEKQTENDQKQLIRQNHEKEFPFLS